MADAEAHWRDVTRVGVGQAAFLVSNELAAHDPPRALELLTLAVELGHPVALYAVGLSLAETNPELAVGYLQRAAESGYAPAEDALGRLRRS